MDTPDRSTAAAFPRYLTGEVVADSVALQWPGLFARRWRLPRVVDRFLVPATSEPHISCNLRGMAEFRERDVGGAWITRQIRAGDLFVEKYTDVAAKTPAVRGGLPIRQLRKVEDRVTENLAEEISIEGLAQLVELSSSHFAHVFNESTGMTPFQFVTRQRITHAQQLIRETSRSLIDVGLEVGYTSPSHFAQVFRRVVGVTPTEFRSSLHNDWTRARCGWRIHRPLKHRNPNKQKEHKTMYKTKAFSAASATSPLAFTSIPRREPTERDVQIEILFCGICHSDLHQVRNEWSAVPTVYPIVPGHEIVGRVTKVGSAVTKYKPGEIVGVGCLVDSDHSCPSCQASLEQFCANAVFTYNSPDKHGTAAVTCGGYSDSIVVDEHFVLRIPANLNLAGAAPLLCAGITTYSPLKRAGVGLGKKVGVVGLGGLGHMGVKLARAFGANVVVFTTSPNKTDDALRLGAHEVVVSRNANEMQKHTSSFDFILDCVPADHDINAYLNLLTRDGGLTLVGAPEKPLSISAFSLIFARRSLSGSLIGGLAETQEMLDFCGKHNITSDVEVIPIQKTNEAYERLLKSDVKYRFSIDMASLKSE